MAVLQWDQIGERRYETGVDHGVLYKPNALGVYDFGVAWNGLTNVTETPSGAESNPQYADNIKYLNLLSAEDFGGTIEAFTYPSEFEEYDGVSIVNNVRLGQQSRKPFGFSYRSLIGNDVEGTEYGYKINLVYGALASPSEKARTTVNDSPEATTFSWEVTTTPVPVGTIGGTTYKPTAFLSIPSVDVDPSNLTALEEILYGTVGTDPRLPMPAEVISLFAGALTVVDPTVPTYTVGTHTITIPGTTGVIYQINGVTQTAGAVVITVDTIVTAKPAAGYKFPTVVVDRWLYKY